MKERNLSDEQEQKLVGAEVRRLRESLGLSERELAEKLGERYSEEEIIRYESGAVPMGIETFFALSEALGVTPNDLSPDHLLERNPASNGYRELNARNRETVDRVIEAVVSLQRGES